MYLVLLGDNRWDILILFFDVNVFYSLFKGFNCIVNDNDFIIFYYCWKSLFGSVFFKCIDKKLGV